MHIVLYDIVSWSLVIHFRFDLFDRLSGKGEDENKLITISYGGSQPHAVTGFNGNTYEYDNNGNQVLREIGSTT